MQEKDKLYFELLKQKIVAMMQQSFPGINPSISNWKGQEIIDFQEELRMKVNEQISEKWFYTHFKSSYDSLPRIDILNFLSRYIGYRNWDDFIFNNKQQNAISKNPDNQNRFFVIIPLLVLITVGILFLFFKIFNTQEYRFTFIDAHTREVLTDTNIEIILLLEGESPMHYIVKSDGSFRLRTDKSRIQLVVKSPCYQTDSIVRIVKKLNRDELIMLKPNVYALMIQFFSMMKVDDWEKRRKMLNEMIDDNAIIYQAINSNEVSGMAMFNKQEFIDRLSIPSNSLKNIEILDSQLINGKIMVLRFRINEKK